MILYLPLFAAILAGQVANAACLGSGTSATTINNALASGGKGTIVQICAGITISISETIEFTADNQEISTEGYPTGDTRATLQIASGASISALISGAGKNYIRILNIQVDGNRANAGYIHNGSANIEIGGTSNGQVVKYVASKNPRAWSCLHVTEGGLSSDYCTNATVSNNDIGPCGQSGTSNGDGLWADGISFACTNSLVESNTVTGSTDGGIVLFGAPGTTVNENTITSSSSYLGFGAINLVDGTYDGKFTNVKVTNNKITGKLLFGAGISIGACVWSGPCKSPYIYTGPATISGNTFSGHITFPVAINGWTGGLTVTGNTVTGVTKPLSAYASDNSCDNVVKDLFNANDLLSYYPAGLTGTHNLQSGFVAMSGNGTNFICATPS
ncbi:pectin lyase fold/virulence factor [Talaromyces proteolyticus]|uniref:Pectin lyase fold/virulence factor n=1 Tax=Talaromyces proteolyticus TaxID=1131652 RepID=A0AAD4Q6J6_9EURO|nr:pectin lyase fold/virulence factor [Talaromyces proteolyticus]KAH8705718.1 pectin lyase fold/virulence factor [Talaromyces proteolyticus]